MGYTTPTTATVGQILTSARWNTEVRDNLRYLKGLDGNISLDSGLTAPTLTATGAVTGATGSFSSGVNVGGGATITGLSTFKRTGVTDLVALYFSDPSNNTKGFFQYIPSGAGFGTRDNTAEFGSVGAIPTVLAPGGLPILRVQSDGKMGLNTASPQGPLDARGSYGKMLFWDGDSIGSTSVTVLPAGSASFVIGLVAVARASTTGVIQQYASYPSATNGDGLGPTASPVIFSDGTNTCRVTFNSNGSVTIARSAGTATFRVALQLLCL
jgi:hypothetical protein